ncbi:MAG TPA: thiamine diphosphokinase [Bacteroidales bacterium]|nr:thiamine diphosphokinase [Bacteroidales bacterium]
MTSLVVILANGEFPHNGIPLGYLGRAGRIVCCDGAVKKLVEHGKEPWAIVGDLDSVPDSLKKKYRALLHHDNDLQINDLSKAVKYCITKEISEVVILGATGIREDHTIGNISLLVDYAESVEVKMVTDWGVFIPVVSPATISTWPGQQVSVFSPDQGTRVRAEGLKYSLDNVVLSNWWIGTLNEAVSDKIVLKPESGRVIVYLNF